MSRALLDFGFSTVVSIDNDVGCINHQIATNNSNNESLQYIYYDICSTGSIDVRPLYLEGSSFDLIIDKATTDALLTQGLLYLMLKEVYRMLKSNG